MNTWYTVVPIVQQYNDEKTIPEKAWKLGNGVFYELIPDWLKEDHIIGHLSSTFKTFLKEEAKYILISKYKANRMGEQEATGTGVSRQERAYKNIRISNLMLWIVHPSAFGFKLVFHIEELMGSQRHWFSSPVGPISPHFRYEDESLEKKDFNEACNLHLKINDLHRKGPLWMALRTVLDALTIRFSWEARYLLLWAAAEALFGSQHEIAFKISLRASSFLGSTAERKKQLFQRVKKGYNWRCKLIHGMKLYELKRPESEKVLYDTEYMIGKTLRKILNDDDLIRVFSDNKKREKYLDDLIF